jgi:hypothetical protein
LTRGGADGSENDGPKLTMQGHLLANAELIGTYKKGDR